MSTADRQTEEFPAAAARAVEPQEGFLASRWTGAAPVATVFWRDMMVIGTGINLALAFASLMALGFKAPTWVAMAIYFSPLPYNLFLVTAIWRGTLRQASPHAGTLRAAALLWVIIVSLI